MRHTLFPIVPVLQRTIDLTIGYLLDDRTRIFEFAEIARDMQHFAPPRSGRIMPRSVDYEHSQPFIRAVPRLISTPKPIFAILDFLLTSFLHPVPRMAFDRATVFAISTNPHRLHEFLLTLNKVVQFGGVQHRQSTPSFPALIT